AKGCVFPQLVELTLAQPCDVFQLAVLSHESSIAKRIDVSVRGLSGDWRSLGYLEFDDNRESGFMARELQTVHLGAAGGTRVMLSLSPPHPNARNVDQQVGLIGLDLAGRPSAAFASQAPVAASVGSVTPLGASAAVPKHVSAAPAVSSALFSPNGVGERSA